MKTPVFQTMTPMWVAFTTRKIGMIPANTQITGLWDLSRQSPRFTEWLEENKLQRKDIKLIRGYVGGGHFCDVWWNRAQ